MPVCKYCLGEFGAIGAHKEHDLADGHSWPQCRDRAANDALLVRSLLGLKDYHSVSESVRVLYEQGRPEFEARKAMSTPSYELKE